MSSYNLKYFDEPNLLFGFNQKLPDPRDGLTLFGTLDNKIAPYGIATGIIGTKEGIDKFKKWLSSIQKPVYNKDNISRPFFPGFEANYNIKWEADKLYEITIDGKDIKAKLYHQDRHYGTYNTVKLFADKIIQATKDDGISVNLWVVVIPDEVYQFCRPESVIPTELITEAKKSYASSFKKFAREESFFEDINLEALPYKYDINFHNQLKARLLPYAIPTQVIRESTLAPESYLNHFGKMKRKLDKIYGHIAWSLSSAAFYKSGGRPWKLGDIRDGVCYIGLAYKQDEKSKDSRNACCAAQMFLDSGDGTVFKGAVGPWYNPKKGVYHLKKKQAREIIELALKTYSYENNRIEPNSNKIPNEIFIHAKNSFNQEEYDGFLEAVPTGVDVFGITIKKTDTLKLYRKLKFPILRGLAYIQNEHSAFLWTQGYVPRLETSLALEVPNCLSINISKGEKDIEVVCKDILALTKLNYNACIYGDGLPVTLRFADNVGEILTAAPLDELKDSPPLAFRYYI